MDSKVGTLAGLLRWIATHPAVTDVDSAAERALAAIDALADHERQAVEPIGDLLNELIDTVGNCKTEERNLKLLLWAETVSQAQAAFSLLDGIDRGK